MFSKVVIEDYRRLRLLVAVFVGVLALALPGSASAAGMDSPATCPPAFAALLHGRVLLVNTCPTGRLRTTLTQQVVAYYSNSSYPPAAIRRDLKKDLSAPASQLGVGGNGNVDSLTVLETLFGAAVPAQSVDSLIGDPNSPGNADLAAAIRAMGEPWPVQPWINNALMLREDVQIVAFYLRNQGTLVGTKLGRTVLPATETSIIPDQITNDGAITTPECGPIYNRHNRISGHECVLTWTVELPSKNKVVVSGSTPFLTVPSGLYSAVTVTFGKLAPRALSESYCLTAPGIFTFDSYSGQSSNGWGSFRPKLVRSHPQELSGAFQLTDSQSSGINPLNVAANVARAHSLLAATSNWKVFAPRCVPFFNDQQAFAGSPEVSGPSRRSSLTAK